jgi:hypothetical protein
MLPHRSARISSPVKHVRTAPPPEVWSSPPRDELVGLERKEKTELSTIFWSTPARTVFEIKFPYRHAGKTASPTEVADELSTIAPRPAQAAKLADERAKAAPVPPAAARWQPSHPRTPLGHHTPCPGRRPSLCLFRAPQACLACHPHPHHGLCPLKSRRRRGDPPPPLGLGFGGDEKRDRRKDSSVGLLSSGETYRGIFVRARKL